MPARSNPGPDLPKIKYMNILRLPFTAEPYRRSLYLLLAVPLALVALVDGGRRQQRCATRLLGRQVGQHRVRGLVGLPLAAGFLVLAGYTWLIVVLNLAYPARPLVGSPGHSPDAWGGPTLAGSWAFHAFLGGVPMLLIMPWLLRGLTAVLAKALGR